MGVFAAVFALIPVVVDRTSFDPFPGICGILSVAFSPMTFFLK